METKLLPAPIPWYRTRWFWGMVFSILVIYTGLSLYASISNVSSISILSINQLLIFAIFSSGGALFFLLGATFGKIGGWILASLFYIIVAFCVYKTFGTKKVLVHYPIFLILLFVSGILIGTLYASGLG
jgi:hypothetical protein